MDSMVFSYGLKTPQEFDEHNKSKKLELTGKF